MPSQSPSLEEIRRLERHYRMNPDGLVFARLADAYRRAGREEEALEILERGLSRHPDYTTGHLVRARTCRALGRAAEAESSFRRVLELDGENLVALRALRELAEQRGEGDSARRWEARLDRLDRSPEAASSGGGGGPEDAGGSEAGPPEESDAPGEGDGEAEETAAPSDVSAVTGPASEREELAREIAALEGGGWRRAPVRAEEVEDTPDDDAGVHTETMAELYARQGFIEEAETIYRELLRRRPEDAELRARLAELGSGEGEAAAEGSGSEPGADDAGPRATGRSGNPGEAAAEPAGESGADPGGQAAGRAAEERAGEPTAREHFRALLRGDARRPGADGSGSGDGGDEGLRRGG